MRKKVNQFGDVPSIKVIFGVKSFSQATPTAEVQVCGVVLVREGYGLVAYEGGVLDGVAIKDFVESGPLFVIGNVPTGDEFIELGVFEVFVVVVDSQKFGCLGEETSKSSRVDVLVVKHRSGVLVGHVDEVHGWRIERGVPTNEVYERSEWCGQA